MSNSHIVTLRRSAVVALSVCVLGSLGGVAVSAPAQAATKPSWTKNCTELHKKYPHGVGRTNAKDHTSGRPVTTFKKSDSLYNEAMKYNKGLDRDKDGIACEQA